MTQEDIVRRMINKNGCQGISCLGHAGSWNQGVECQFSEKDGRCRLGDGDEDNFDDVAPEVRAWMSERGLYPFSSTFTVEHRFKPGDRVQHKGDMTGPVITVAEVILGEDCGVFYRFAEEGVPTGSISYCDENLRLADCDDEAGQAGEVKYYTRDCRDCEKGTGYSDVCFTCQTTATGWETD